MKLADLKGNALCPDNLAVAIANRDSKEDLVLVLNLPLPFPTMYYIFNLQLYLGRLYFANI